MDIILFKDITTEEQLIALEAEALTYDNLYVDMEDGDARKFVKERASIVTSMLKKVDRTRIDVTRAFKIKVDAEAENITSRLTAVNKPFTRKIDEHKAERQKVLDAEKAVQAAKDLIIQIANDHDEALLMDRIFEFDHIEEIRIQAERDDLIRKEATTQAEIKAAKDAEEIEYQRESTELARIADLARRENDREHKANTNNAAVACLMSELEMSELDAKDLVTVIAKGLISNIVINY